MPAVATTINAKLVLNGSQYAQELERTKGLTARTLRDVEKQQARTQGSSTMQVQAGRFAVGSASRNAPMRIEGDPKQTKLFEEIRDALLKPSYARAS